MEIKDLKFYVTWQDDSGHTKLIPQEQWLGFCAEEQRLVRQIIRHETHSDEWYDANDDYNNYIDSFKTLEGESHYVVLCDEMPYILK